MYAIRSYYELNTTIITVLLIIGGLGVSGSLKAQENSVTLEQAIERAKENYPSLKAASLDVEKQHALKATRITSYNVCYTKLLREAKCC